MEIIINDIKSALEAAKLKHPDWSKYTIQDMALIVSEEAGEISKAVVDFKLMEKVPLEEVQMELLQTAAMCLRMLENIGVYKEDIECGDDTPTLIEVESRFKHLRLLPDEVKDIRKYCVEMYDAGFSDGTDDQLEEFELKESNEICIGLDYALESFEGIQTISGFKDKYLELERLRLNHTPPTGLLLTSLNQSKLFINQ